jgi:hypothetical protein
MDVEISPEVTKAVEDVMSDVAPKVVEEFIQQLRRQISPEQIKEKAQQLLDSEELRKEVAVRQVFLTLDLYEIQMANWVDILKTTKESLDEVLRLKAISIKAANEETKKLREVDLAEVALNKARAEEDWDIALLRFKKVRGHLFGAIIILVLGIFVGQTIASFQPAAKCPPIQRKK